MKRVFSMVMIVVVFLSAFGVAEGARAAGSLTYVGARFVWGKGVVFVFEGTGLKNKDLKGAVLFVESNDYKLSCSVNKDEGRIICVASGGLTKYAGEIGIVTVAGRFFSVRIPGRTLPATQDPSDSSLNCPEGTEPGADVTFFTNQETLETIFVSGASLSEVQNHAENMLGEVLLNIEEIGSLYCGEQPS